MGLCILDRLQGVSQDLYSVARSQNADRCVKDALRREAVAGNVDDEDGAGGAILSPLIPNQAVWLRKARRLLLGQEALMVQGVYDFDTKDLVLSQSKMRGLAGQAMCCASTIPCLVAQDVFW